MLKRTTLALLFSLVAGLASAATPPVFDNASSGGSGSAASLTFSHTVGGGASRYLACSVSTQDTSKTATGVTYGGVPLTKRAELDNADDPGRPSRVEYWDKVGPTAGTADVIVTMNAATAVSADCLSYTGVDPTTPRGTIVSAKGDSATVSVTASSATDEVVIDAASLRLGTTTITVGAGQTSRVVKLSAAGVGNVTLGMSSETGAASTVMSWTVDDATAKAWTAIAVPLKGVTLSGTQITVCASGCTYTNSQLQTALNAAVRGDEVLVQSGSTYTPSSPSDGFVLGAQCMVGPQWDCITLRTGISAVGTVMSRSAFPADDVRMTTAYRGMLAKFLPAVNNEGSIRTIYPGETGATCTVKPCLGSGWTLKWLEFGPKADWMSRALVRFGTNKNGQAFIGGVWVNQLPDGETQDTLVEIPTMLSFIQNDIHGDPIGGQHQGIILSAAATRIWNNSFKDFKSLSETQAITGLNGIGPDSVINNLIEGSGENTMWGGSDSYLQLQATVSGSPTTTSVTLSSPVWTHMEGTTTPASLATDIYSGIFISITHAGTEYSGLTCTLTGSTCTFQRSLPVTPSVGDVVKWSLLPSGTVYRYNHVLKPPEWFPSALAAITGVSPTAGTGGTLTAGTHCYVVVGVRFVSGGNANTPPSTEQCVTTGASGSVTLDWPDMASAINYRVYGNGAAGAENQYWTVTNSTFTDTGTAGTAGTAGTGNIWVVKNNAEWKNGDGAGFNGPIVVEGNIFDYSWCCSQSNVISIKVNNQDGKDVSATVRNFTFRNNWIRHGNRGLALSTATGPFAGGYMMDVTVTNNLFTDLSPLWSKSGPVGNTPFQVTTYLTSHVVGSRGGERITLTHNTVLVGTGDMSGPMWFNLDAATDLMLDFVLRDNIMARDCASANCISNGNRTLKTFAPNNLGNSNPVAAWNGAVTGSSFVDHNAWPDGTSSQYLVGTFPNAFFPTDTDLKATHMVDYPSCLADSDILGCGLQATSNMHLAASDGTDIGANTTTIKAFTDIALSGDNSGVAPDPTRPRYRLRIRGGVN